MEKIQQQINFAELAKQQLAGLQEDIETASFKFTFKDAEYRRNSIAEQTFFDKVKNKYRYVMDKNSNRLILVKVDDIYPIDEIPEKYEGYIDEDDLKKIY